MEFIKLLSNLQAFLTGICMNSFMVIKQWNLSTKMRYLERVQDP